MLHDSLLKSRWGFTILDLHTSWYRLCSSIGLPVYAWSHELHLLTLKRVLCYLKGIVNNGLHIRPYFVDRLVSYIAAGWVGCLDTRWSTSRFCVYPGDNLVSWLSKRQHVVSRSSTEAEYQGVVNGVAEAAWLRNLLLELSCLLTCITVVFYDNMSAMHLASNLVQHQRTNHVEIDLYFIRERITIGQVRVLHSISSSVCKYFHKRIAYIVISWFLKEFMHSWISHSKWGGVLIDFGNIV